MELIKHIKQTEAQAQEIIEQAKSQTVKHAQQFRENKQKALAEAEVKRKKTIEAAVAAAESEGAVEVARLKENARKEHNELREKATGKMGAAVAKVIDKLKG